MDMPALCHLTLRSAKRVSKAEVAFVAILRDAGLRPFLRMRTALALCDFIGEGVAQADGAVEHRLAGRTVLVAREVALALELHRLGRIVGDQRRFKPRAAEHFERVWVEFAGEIRDVRLRLCE